MKFIADLHSRRVDKGVLTVRCVLFSLALMVGAAHSQEPPKPQPKQEKTNANQRGTEQAPFFVKIPAPTSQAERDYETYEKDEKPANERKITNATVALAWITGVLAFFTAALWVATYSLVRGAKDTAEKELRAYVFVQTGSIQNLSNGQHPTSRLIIHNFGKTPAHKLTVICGIGFGKSFEELPTAVPPLTKPMGTLAPGGTVEHYNSAPIAFTADHMSALENGTYTLYVHGEIRYIDFLEKNRVTKFRVMKSAVSGLSGPQLASCEDGNDAD